MTRVLMSGVNPTGWKLEELMTALIADLELKTHAVSHDKSPTTQEIARLNRDSIHSFKSVLMNQTLILAELRKIAPDQGPTEKPRVGRGTRGELPDGLEPADRAFIESLEIAQTVIAGSTGRAAYLRPILMGYIGPSVAVVVVSKMEHLSVQALAGLRNLVIDPHLLKTAPGALVDAVEAFVKTSNLRGDFKL